VIERTQGQARSLSLDLYDQWRTMEAHHGKWRFTSPTHVVRAFFQALGNWKPKGGSLPGIQDTAKINASW
jgi:2-aminoethylphosphonate-pyruvate transaminase